MATAEAPTISAPVELGQAVGEAGQQLGGGVGLAVPGRVQLGVLEAEVGGEVDHPPHLLAQHRHEGLGRAVGQAAEHQVDPVEQRRVVAVEDQAGVGRGQARVQLGERGARLAVAGGEHDPQLGMGGAAAAAAPPPCTRMHR